ncbi:MAG: Zn-dependent hydrolase, partial [Candidatus Aminicenantes bacterium]
MVKNLRVNPERLHYRLMELAKPGETPDGGVNRVAFTNEDIQGREFIIALMKKTGLSVTIDEAANIIGTLKGRNPNLPPILFGSHIDSVPNGGKYDGPVGVLGAIECIEVLGENNITPHHSLQVVVFTNEEEGMTGSRGIVGEMDDVALNAVSQSGKTVREGVRFLGGNPDKIKNAAKKKEDIKAYLELHIEQGAVVESKNLQIGIVEGIVGINWWDILIEGKANHAGTTPMNLRQDSLLAAGHLIVEINRLVTAMPGTQVATVGNIASRPGAYNVIAGSVCMTLDIRDISSPKIQSIFSQIREKSLEIAKKTGTRISFKAVEDILSVPTDPDICRAISEAAGQLDLTS